jgi:hypothetical protein
MIADKKVDERIGAGSIEDRWREALDGLCDRIAHRFRHPEVRGRVRRYLTGIYHKGRQR